MAIKLTTARDDSVEVWLGVNLDGRWATSSEHGVLIGHGKTADLALSGAVANLGDAVQDLADRQRLSAVEGYKRREPV